MTKGYITVKIEYSTSLEKWKGIRRFAELNNIETGKINTMIARIEKVGDASLDELIVFKINNMDEFRDSIYNSFEHPCPHCEIYFECRRCPLGDDSLGCCREWSAVKEHY